MTYADRYAAFLRTFADLRRPLRAVFDCSNGPTELIVPKVYARNPRLRLFLANKRLSGNFPAHGPNPLLPRAQACLAREVREHRADIGVVFDADGDRAFYADDRGRPVPSHVIAHLLFMESRPPFIADILTYESLRMAGLLAPRTFPSRVGSFFIKRKMRTLRAGAAAEYSGHYYFQEFYGQDSGILSAVRVLNAVSRLPYGLAAFVDLLPTPFHSEQFNVQAADPSKLIKEVRNAYGKKSVRSSVIDGLTLEFGGWVLNVRPSNTEPLLRVFVGATLQSDLKMRVREVEKLLKRINRKN